MLHFLTLCCPFYQSNVSQEKQSCLKLIQCLIFMISLIILTTKIHKKIGIDPSLEQTLPLYLTLALMISFPAGRGCILSIFSHSCCNHRSTTASGLSQKKKKLDSLLSYHKCTCLIGCTNWCIFLTQYSRIPVVSLCARTLVWFNLILLFRTFDL